MSFARPLDAYQIKALQNIFEELKFAESKDENFNRERKLVVYTLEYWLKKPEVLIFKNVRNYLDNFPHIAQFFQNTCMLDVFKFPGVLPLDAEEVKKEDATEKKSELDLTLANDVSNDTSNDRPTDIQSASLKIIASIAPEIKKAEQELNIPILSEFQRNELLLTSIEKNHLAKIYLLLQHEVDINKDIDDPKLNPLSVALEQRRYEAIILLLDKGCEIKTYHLSKVIDYLSPHMSPLVPLIMDEMRRQVAYPSLWHQRAFEGKPEDLKAFAEMELEDFSVKDYKNVSPLLYICASGRIDTLHAFFAHPRFHESPKERAAVLEDKNNDFLQTPIYWAVDKNHVEFVKVLVEKYKADVTAKAWEVLGSLLDVTSSVEMLDLLVRKYKLDINTKSNNGDTFLHRVCSVDFVDEKRSLELIARAVEVYGADVNAQNVHGVTPLYISVFKDSWPEVNLLLKYNADPSVITDKGLTPICAAQSLEMAEFLFGFVGAKIINSVGANGLNSFKARASFSAIEVLLRNGMNPNARDMMGITRLHIDSANKDTMKCLLNYGAKIDDVGEAGLTPILMAAMQNDLIGVIHLHQQGASLRASMGRKHGEWYLQFLLRLHRSHPVVENKLNDCAAIYTYLLAQYFLAGRPDLVTWDITSLLNKKFPLMFQYLLKVFLSEYRSIAALDCLEAAREQADSKLEYTQFINFILAKIYLKMARNVGFDDEIRCVHGQYPFRSLIDMLRKAAACFEAVRIIDYCNGYVELLDIATKLEEMLLRNSASDSLEAKSIKFFQNPQALQVNKLFQLKPLQLEVVKLVPEHVELTDVAYLQYASLILKLHEPLNLTFDQAVQRASVYAQKAHELASNPEIRREAIAMLKSLEGVSNLARMSLEYKGAQMGSAIDSFHYINKLAVFAAVKSNNLLRLKKLLAKNANPNVKDEQENTPLFFATSRAVTECLLEYGADANAINVFDQTPLSAARSLDVVNVLLSRVVFIPSHLSRNAKFFGSTSTDEQVKFFVEHATEYYAFNKQYHDLICLGLHLEKRGKKSQDALTYSLLRTILSLIPTELDASLADLGRLRSLNPRFEKNTIITSAVSTGLSFLSILNPLQYCRVKRKASESDVESTPTKRARL